jgi:hypothetical protein
VTKRHINLQNWEKNNEKEYFTWCSPWCGHRDSPSADSVTSHHVAVSLGCFYVR